ncbi:hypothetical protein [Cellulosimicrobium sp. TH-20]|uniref:hypothetical protein n=1 Tax=Cellulosimicrobium sp. TH-20 TaxID=1980001 RepID=UPI0011A298F4|nr:hypothetical protein [Cellulosimicrobium sp. TH-20]
MGRSILPAPGAVEVLYFALPDADDVKASWLEYLREDDPEATLDDVSDDIVEQDHEHVYSDLIDRLPEALSERYPSFYAEDESTWSGRENRVVATNGMADVLVTQYGDLIAVSIAARSDRRTHGGWADTDWWRHEETLREGWTKRMAKHLAGVIREAVYLEEYGKLGTFSDGTSVYAKAA